jgi:hypothetical protein
VNKVKGTRKKELIFLFRAASTWKGSQWSLLGFNVKGCIQEKKGSGWKMWDEGQSLSGDVMWEGRS